MIGSVVSSVPPRSRIARWARAAAVVACAAIAAAPALAQPTAEEIAQRAVAAIEQTTRNTSGRLENGSARAVLQIEELDKNGAPDRRIIAFGHSAAGALNRAALAGRERIEATTRTAVRALRRLSAPQALIDQVTAAARAGTQTIGQARQQALQAVRDAVEEAIGPP